jgi:hypothetical protein
LNGNEINLTVTAVYCIPTVAQINLTVIVYC